jgi:hypothetical protein
VEDNLIVASKESTSKYQVKLEPVASELAKVALTSENRIVIVEHETMEIIDKSIKYRRRLRATAVFATVRAQRRHS